MRLIDADKLMEDFRNTITEQSNTFDWLNMISRQPTTYGLDKVVEQVGVSKRKYVIVCNEHSAGWLLFWGHRTQDHESRSFGGYTKNIDSCEIYSENEVKEKGYHFPKYYDGMSWEEFRGYDDILIEPKDLEKLGYKQMRVWYMQ
ncbi:MAG: hypothetical protein HFI59_06270 [Lachnospiraceae bacterium]|nr:hypothetical protein [Lachnospiraceae bacterium]